LNTVSTSFPGHEPVRLNDAHAGWLRDLSADNDLAWASACPEDLNHYCGMLIGLDPMPRVPMPSPPFAADQKVRAVDDFVGTRAVAWLDDAFGRCARLWARTRRSPTTLIDVDASVGLTQDLVSALAEWSHSLREPG
jgi:hypothetical protein